MPTLLTPHFSYEELNLPLEITDDDNRIVDNYKELCLNVMEPIRAKYGALFVTSGYRDVCRNINAGGKENSFHLAEGGHAAIDFKPLPGVGVKLTDVFDWVRMGSSLPFDKVIIEYASGSQFPSIIHVQYDRVNNPRREAYEGYTGAATEYNRVVVV